MHRFEHSQHPLAHVIGDDHLDPVFTQEPGHPGVVARFAAGLVRHAPPDVLTAVAGASALFTTPAAPIGTALGGPIVAGIGARATLTGSGLVTVAVAGLATAVLIRRRVPRLASGRPTPPSEQVI